MAGDAPRAEDIHSLRQKPPSADAIERFVVDDGLRQFQIGAPLRALYRSIEMCRAGEFAVGGDFGLLATASSRSTGRFRSVAVAVVG